MIDSEYFLIAEPESAVQISVSPVAYWVRVITTVGSGLVNTSFGRLFINIYMGLALI